MKTGVALLVAALLAPATATATDLGAIAAEANNGFPSKFGMEGCRLGDGYPPGQAWPLMYFVWPRDAAAPTNRSFEDALPMIRQIWDRDGGDVLVEGHRDAVDPDGSDRRWADGTAAALAAAGIPAHRIWPRGFGASHPLIDTSGDSSEADRQQNRRVVIHATQWGRDCQARYSRALTGWLRENCAAAAGSRAPAVCDAAWERLRREAVTPSNASSGLTYGPSRR